MTSVTASQLFQTPTIGIWIFAFVIRILLAASPAEGQLFLGGAPHDGYYKVFGRMYDGEFVDAMEAFREGSSLGVRTVDGRWIDSVCYNVMAGECAYHLGDLKTALDQYNGALRIFLDQRSWMQNVQFPNVVAAVNPNDRTLVPWGLPNRRSLPGAFPESMQILVGKLDNSDVARRGGVLLPPEFRSLNVAEVVRCLCTALRRRAELLGPLGPHDPLSSELVATYESGIGPTNHWAEAWVQVQYGLALSGLGRHGEAAGILERSSLVSGTLTHPASGLALEEMARLTSREGQYERAEQLYIEASVAAAEFGQFWLVEESLQEANALHIARNDPQPLAVIPIALQWAQREQLRHLSASLMVASAESLLNLRQPAPALALLTEARKFRGRRNTVSAQLSARMDHQTAVADLDLGKGPAAMEAAAAALRTQQMTSPWLFQIGMLDRLYVGQPSSNIARRAAELYDELLREPTPDDWLRRTLDTLAVRMAPNPAAYEHWFDLTLDRGEFEKALKISEVIRRHKFHSQLPLAGRLLSLRWVLEAPETSLDEEGLRRRRDLRDRYPELATSSDESDAVIRQWTTLLALKPAGEEDAALKSWQQKLTQSSDHLRRIADNQELMLEEIAMRREPAPLAFPPHFDLAEIQKRLGTEQIAIDFVVNTRGGHGFAISKDGLYHWKLPATSQIRKNIIALLKSIGMTGENGPVTDKLLKSDAWKQLSAAVMNDLVQQSQQGAWGKFKELLIIPDGILWYVPFEALHYHDSQGDQVYMLGDKIPIRYAPSLGLAVQSFPREVRNPTTWVVPGKLQPQQPDTAITEQIEELENVIPNLHPLSGRLAGATGIERVTWDRLLVLDDVLDAKADGLNWSPARLDAGRPGSELSRWMSLPWGAPQQVLFPAFHTGAEHATKGLGTGDEVSNAILGLMASGVRSVVLSRWRTGGQSSIDMMREYLQEIDGMSASESLQRAGQVVRASDLDPAWEPRLSVERGTTTIAADHPFFWAGYLVADAGHDPLPKDPLAIDTAEPAKGIPAKGIPAKDVPPQAPSKNEPKRLESNPDTAPAEKNPA